MSNEGYVQITGNVVREPELRFTPSGAACCTLSIAVNRRWKNRQTDEWEEAVSFFDIVAWRELAENIAESIAKGNRVVVVGRLEQRSWENDAGEKRSKVEVIADEVAPSMRWATAQVTRNERHQGTGGFQQDQAPPAEPPPAAPYNDDEEPF